ncbi:SPRY domain-containing SOCS box protein 3 [Nephila pilipes]|uniref:SPRY domain-containing SOCS box protein 3 n=1 Tax=Nephila pilipes TaxID=299642 RepID=A0A8X6NZ33_NEPPI|nr:SPRY domain-containing SOCS box protein 3 [Nephila pilipes]
MFRSLLQEASTPNLGRHRSLIEALFGVKNDCSSENSDPDEQIEWTWDNAIENDFVFLLNNNKDVKFHRNISSGTAVVRGTQPMSKDQYYWEVKMISPVYGTDMMIGVGTAEADMNQVHDKFISLLGKDNKTWGLSYTGLFRHNGESRDYSSRFGQGSVIGIHLDMWNGTLAFYKNKKHLGIASRGLKGKTMYAMASSTAACSGMRIIRSCSFPSSLQFLCCTKLRELIPDEKDVLKEIDLPPGLQVFLENNLSWLLCSRYTETVVQQCMPSPSRRGLWGYGLDSVSEILLPVQEDETQSTITVLDRRTDPNIVVMNGGAIFLCNCNVDGERSIPPTSFPDFNPNPPSPESCFTPLPDYFINPPEFEQLPSDEISQYMEQDVSCSTQLGASIEDALGTTNKNTIVNESRRADLEAAVIETIIDDSEEYNPIESEAKRRRHSYNYIMGLSDPDSE